MLEAFKLMQAERSNPAHPLHAILGLAPGSPPAASATSPPQQKQPRPDFSLETLVDQCPILSGILHPRAPLGLHEFVQIEAPSKSSTPNDKEASDGEDEEEDEIFAPRYEEDRRRIIVSRAMPSASQRTIRELLPIVHYVALARDNPRPQPAPQTATTEGSAVASKEEEDDAGRSEKDLMHAAQSTIADVASAHAIDYIAGGNRNRADTAVEMVNTALRGQIARSPWDPPVSPQELSWCQRRVLPVTGSVLVLSAHQLIYERFAKRLESAKSSFFFSRDAESVLRFTGAVELLRWRLIRAAIDDNLLVMLQSTIRQQKKRLERFGVPPTLTSLLVPSPEPLAAAGTTEASKEVPHSVLEFYGTEADLIEEWKQIGAVCVLTELPCATDGNTAAGPSRPMEVSSQFKRWIETICYLELVMNEVVSHRGIPGRLAA